MAEAVVVALPLTALLGLGIATMSISKDAFWPLGAMDLVTVLAAVAVFAGWWLIIKAVRGGAEALRIANRSWWFTASFGPLLVVAAVVSMLLPASPEYSSAAIFREHLERCVFGAPLVVVLAHLWAEARFRKSANETIHATREEARV